MINSRLEQRSSIKGLSESMNGRLRYTFFVILCPFFGPPPPAVGRFYIHLAYCTVPVSQPEAGGQQSGVHTGPATILDEMRGAAKKWISCARSCGIRWLSLEFCREVQAG